MRRDVERVIRQTLETMRTVGTLSDVPAFSVDVPKNADHGDFATNAAMLLAKSEGKNPRALAELIRGAIIADQVRQSASALIADVTIAGPGFLNFKLHDAAIRSVLLSVVTEGDHYGHAQKPVGERVLVEFVSANPTGPLHLGHARGAFTGDAVARLLAAAGYDVVREFYVNDTGNQVQTLGRSVHTRYRELFGEEVTIGPGEYPAPYIIDIAKCLRDEDGNKWLTAPESAWLPRCTEIGIRENLRAIRETLTKAGIVFDVWAYESEFHRNGKVLAVVDSYRARGETYEAEHAHGGEDKKRRDESKAAKFADKQHGGTFLETSKYGDEEDRIILRADGTPVYLTADLAYHKDKADRGFDTSIDVWGADHAGHVPRIRAGMEALGIEKNKRGESRFEFLLVQIVRLTRDNKELKISKRTGQIYELAELIDEIGADAVRFIFLMRSANTQFDFDVALALQNSNDNPVFYCQMGHARCATVLRRAVEKGVTLPDFARIDAAALQPLTLPEERSMLLKVSQFSDVVRFAAEAREPHRVLHFAQDLIGDFHSYFSKYKNSHRIVTDDVAVTTARLALVFALKQVLKNSLELLGIAAPDWMETGEGET